MYSGVVAIPVQMIVEALNFMIRAIVAQVRRAKAKCSSECKSRPGKGRCDREAIPAAVEAMTPSECSDPPACKAVKWPTGL